MTEKDADFEAALGLEFSRLVEHRGGSQAGPPHMSILDWFEGANFGRSYTQKEYEGIKNDRDLLDNCNIELNHKVLKLEAKLKARDILIEEMGKKLQDIIWNCENDFGRGAQEFAREALSLYNASKPRTKGAEGEWLE